MLPHVDGAAEDVEQGERRLEIDLVVAAVGLIFSLLLVQCLHWRPSALLTHGGMAMCVGAALNACVWMATAIAGRPHILSIVISPQVHSIVYFGLIPPIIFEAGFSVHSAASS